MKISADAILTTTSCLRISARSEQRVFVVGDLDANLRELRTALDRVEFSPKQDLLISLGDAIDRGEDSVAVLEYFQSIDAKMVLGNHEHIMLESILGKDEVAMKLWVQNGGDWHLSESEERVQSLCEWLLHQPLSIVLDYQTYKIGFSHTLPIQWDWDSLPSEKSRVVSSLLWDRVRVKKRRHVSNVGVDFSIHGHNSTPVPFWISNTYHIDTSYYGRPTLVELKNVISKYELLKKFYQ